MFPTISIVTPSYNQGQFLEETIRSVLLQEGEFYIDYLIVDGASTDNSVSIIKMYDELIRSKKFVCGCSGIQYRWLSEKDKGQADAINKGFRMMSGDIIAWINSDDTYFPGTFGKIMKIFSDHPLISIIVGDAVVIDESGRRISKYKAKFDSYEQMIKVWEGRGNTIPQPSVFLRKQVLETVGELDVSLRYTMDYDFFLRCSSRYRFNVIPEILSTYRIHSESKTVSGYDAMAWESYRVSRKHWKNLDPLQYIQRWIDVFSGESRRCFKVAQDATLSDSKKRRHYIIRGSLIYPKSLFNQDGLSLFVRALIGDRSVESLKRYLLSSSTWKYFLGKIFSHQRLTQLLEPKLLPKQENNKQSYKIEGIFDDCWTTERFNILACHAGVLRITIFVHPIFIKPPTMIIKRNGGQETVQLPMPGEYVNTFKMVEDEKIQFIFNESICPVERDGTQDNRFLSVYLKDIQFTPISVTMINKIS